MVFAAKALAGRDAHQARRPVVLLRGVRWTALVRGWAARSPGWWRHDGLPKALAVAERVRWQLASWQASPGQGPRPARTAARAVSRRLRGCSPRSAGARREGASSACGGNAAASDRVGPSPALRVQAMLGHGAVTRPVLAGGRGPADQPEGATGAVWRRSAAPALPAGPPWPGRRSPCRARPRSAPESAARAGSPTAQRPRGDRSPGVPRSPRPRPGCAIERRAAGWWSRDRTGPWPVTERWWQQSRLARRRARFQLVTGDGAAWLAAVARTAAG